LGTCVEWQSCLKEGQRHRFPIRVRQ
jgi:hypothetical protein